MDTPIISVCVPTYNGASYLRECLDSVLAQTFRDFEVVIIDDHSEDSTLSVANEYAALDSRVRITQNRTNLGLVRNWNSFIPRTRGLWIKYVFQDDTLDPLCLQKLHSAAVARVPLVLCKRRFAFDESVVDELRLEYESLPTLDHVFPNTGFVGADHVCTAVLHEPRNFFGEPTSALIHRDAFTRFGLFNPDLIQFCDLEYWTRVATNTGFIIVPDTLATFRVHAKSTSATNRATRAQRSALDQALMLHEFAYGTAYAHFRKVTATVMPRRHLQRAFATKIAWIEATALSQQKLVGISGSSTVLEDLRNLAKRYPMLKKSPDLFLMRIQRWLSRHLYWRPILRNHRSRN